MIIKKQDNSYNHFIQKIYNKELVEKQKAKRNKKKKIPFVRNVTFQVTDDCPMACTYCYQTHKGNNVMTKETAKKGVDLLFKLYEENNSDFINKDTHTIILDFIGGEPLMNVEVIEYTCEYFMDECIRRNHPWLFTWRASMISNGALYFKPEVQKFLSKFHYFVSFGITLDGPKDIHDSCRKYHNGSGNFDDAYKAAQHYHETYKEEIATKVTIAPENLLNLNKIIKFFTNDGVQLIHANCVFEADWNEEHAKIFYKELKEMADYLLELNDETTITLFNDKAFEPMSPKDNNNYCGGTGAMIAFGPDGTAYPCLRYSPSSISNNRKLLISGSVNGLYETLKQKFLKHSLDKITRRSQSTNECFYCPIAKGCAWCSAWNYDKYGTPNKRCTNICVMHKARSLANVYYWNKWYKQNGEDKKMRMWLPKEEALKIVDETEYNMLLNLSKEED